MRHRPRIALHWFHPFGSVNFQDICNFPPVHGIADLRIIFWDQEPVYKDNAKEFFDKFVEVYKGPKVLVASERGSDIDWVCNTYGLTSSHYFFHGWAALDWYRGYDHSFLSLSWQDRKFTSSIFCPNNIVGGRRTHRLKLFSAMEHHNLLTNNLISFPAVCPYEKVSVQKLLRQHRLKDTKINLPLVIDQDKNHANDSHKIDFWGQAQSSFCHVVTETAYDDSRTHITEKSFKPIVLQQPFMIVGTPGSLSYLKNYGFKTFDVLWDEGYDSANSHDRINLIIKNMIKINSWTHAELEDAQKEAQSIVEHNYRWFYGEFQHVLWAELKNMIDQWR